MSTCARPIAGVLLLGLMGTTACRDPQELAGSVTAILIVVDLEDDDVVEVAIADRALRATPNDGDNLVSFSLPLATGTHVGDVVVLQVEDDGERPRDCGPVTIVVPDDTSEPVLVAVVADDLGECPEAGEGPEVEAELEGDIEP